MSLYRSIWTLHHFCLGHWTIKKKSVKRSGDRVRKQHHTALLQDGKLIYPFIADESKDPVVKLCVVAPPASIAGQIHDLRAPHSPQ